jgi:hypothetical protein
MFLFFSIGCHGTVSQYYLSELARGGIFAHLTGLISGFVNTKLYYIVHDISFFLYEELIAL